MNTHPRSALPSSLQRRPFLKGVAALAGLSWLPAAGRAQTAAGRPGAEGTFTTMSLFSSASDMPDDLFGDLCVMRKGSSGMTAGEGVTTIQRISTPDEWSRKRQAIEDIFWMTLGSPVAKVDCDLALRVEKETEHETHLERRVSYLLAPGERVGSLLLVPKGQRKRSAAVLTIHPTTADGKEQTVGRGEKVNGVLTPAAARRAYGLELVKRGYVTFSPDLLGAGERMYPGRRHFDNQPFIDAHPTWSGTGKDLWDLKRALDVLTRQPEVDAQRIASLGHSQGAGLTCLLAAVDQRIKVAVSNCGVWPTRISKNPFNAARTEWYTARPSMRAFCWAGKPFPVDAHEMMALIAPRPYLNISALNDVGFSAEEEGFTRAAWSNLETNVKRIYALHGKAEHFGNVVHLKGHDFHDDMREISYAFLDRHL
jgi:hypothetical protein